MTFDDQLNCGFCIIITCANQQVYLVVDSGLTITFEDQLNYNVWMAEQVGDAPKNVSNQQESTVVGVASPGAFLSYLTVRPL